MILHGKNTPRVMKPINPAQLRMHACCVFSSLRLLLLIVVVALVCFFDGFSKISSKQNEFRCVLVFDATASNRAAVI